MVENIEEALQLARKLEMDGIDFYTDASDKAASSQAKRLFDSLCGDEKRHLDVVEKIGKGMGVNVEDMPSPAENIETIFTEASEEIGERSKVSAAENEVIDMALDIERRSYKLYDDAAQETNDSDQKKLFERLAHEENQHYRMLENTREYLDNNDEWFLWKEWGLLTGDLSSLGGA